VQRAGATGKEYLGTLSVAWEILPPGTIGEVLAKLYKGRQPTPKERKEVQDRYDFLMGLAPQKLVFGMSGVSRYFGGQVLPNLVVFENMAYGNAIYIMFDDWQALSKRSRIELLHGRLSLNFERVPHIGDWKAKVKGVVEEHVRLAKNRRP
jgi:hypothetical protein